MVKKKNTLFQGTKKKRNLTRENVGVAKKGTPQERNWISFLIAAQNTATRIIYVKAKIDNNKIVSVGYVRIETGQLIT